MLHVQINMSIHANLTDKLVTISDKYLFDLILVITAGLYNNNELFAKTGLSDSRILLYLLRISFVRVIAAVMHFRTMNSGKSTLQLSRE